MKIKISTLAISMIILIFGGILISSSLGWWKTDTNLKQNNSRYDGIESQLDPAEIRGSFSFAEISDLFSIPLETMAEAFMLPDSVDPQYFYNRGLDGLYGPILAEDQEIGNSAVQYFVALYTGLPYQSSEVVFLPQAAVNILKSQGQLTDEQIKYLNTHTIQIDPNELGNALDSYVEEEHDQGEALVKGTTTFYDVLAWGVSESDVMAVFDGNMPPTNMLVRDYCTQNKLEFAAVKIALQKLVDAAHP